MSLDFTDSGVQKIAEIAWEVNDRTENIGARRLHTVLERILDDASFDASDKPGEALIIDEQFVTNKLSDLVQDQDLSRFIL